MGILEPKIKIAQAVDIIAKEKTKSCYKKPEFWIGVTANIIALGALVVAIIALGK